MMMAIRRYLGTCQRKPDLGLFWTKGDPDETNHPGEPLLQPEPDCIC